MTIFDTLSEKLPCLEKLSCSNICGKPKRNRDLDETETPEMLAWNLGLISPNGPRKTKWDWFVLCLVFYTSISVPFQLAFYAFSDPQNSPTGFVFDVMIDMCYIADIFVSWRTTYYDREGLLVMDRRQARNKYLKTWFALDLFASFPFEYTAQLITIGSDVDVPGALRLPSLAKLLRIFRLGKKIDRLSSSKTFRIFQFTCMLLMAAHFYACMWFYFGGLAEPKGGVIDPMPGSGGTSWVYRLDMENEDTSMKYASALYWAVTTLMKSPWFHPNSPFEFISATVMIIFGCVLFAYFLGNVTAVITAANAAGGRYRGQIEQLRSFCRSQSITQKMTDKLLVYQDALWTETNNGSDLTAMINALPYHLLPYVLIGHIYRPLMDACPFLYDCSAWGCVEFLKSLKVQVCEKGDTLIRQGTLIGAMYILVRGEVKIHQEQDAPQEMAEDYVMGGRIGAQKKAAVRKTKSAKDMMRGRTDKFGTLMGFQDPSKPNTPREYHVDAMSRVSLLMITRAQLNGMLTAYPQDKDHILKAIETANTTHIGGGERLRRSSTMAKRGSKDETELTAKGGDRRLTPTSSAIAKAMEETSKSDVSLASVPEGGSGLSFAKHDEMDKSGLSFAQHDEKDKKEDSPPSRRAQNSKQWLGGLLSPMTDSHTSSEMANMRNELAEQRKLIEAQSKMLETVLKTLADVQGKPSSAELMA